MKVKAASPNSPRLAHIPCGSCKSCRNTARQGWFVRLSLELKEKLANHWKAGFITLTYNNENLPTIPASVITNPSIPADTPCFNRFHVRDLVIKLRDFLYKRYGCCRDDSLVYMIVTEYGELTHRPHYHGIFCVPPRVDLRAVYDFISSYWNANFGFVCPRKYEGGRSRSGKRIAPFELKFDASACARYVAKYVCKDLSFWKQFSKEDFTKEIKYYAPFHIQSRSLGFCYIESLSESQKMNLIKNGVSVDVSDVMVSIPVYFKNKILFTPEYIVDSRGKRLVRRRKTEFLEKYKQELYDLKISRYEDILSIFRQSQNCTANGMDRNSARSFARSVDDFIGFCGGLRNAARNYFLYYGVPFRLAKTHSVDAVDFWLSRFSDKPVTLDSSKCNIDYLHWRSTQDFYSMFFGELHLLTCVPDEKTDSDKFKDFYFEEF